jgi:predicted enzyme related to lactoylglutathione lyase
MFGNTPAFSSFAVDDLEAARAFYGKTLGLTVEDLPYGGGLLSIRTGDGHSVMVYPKPDFTPATYTVLHFQVEDVDAAVEQLITSGVTMERYDGFDQDDKGIARDSLGPPIAWFRDPAGNILGVTAQTP